MTKSENNFRIYCPDFALPENVFRKTENNIPEEERHRPPRGFKL